MNTSLFNKFSAAIAAPIAALSLTICGATDATAQETENNPATSENAEAYGFERPYWQAQLHSENSNEIVVFIDGRPENGTSDDVANHIVNYIQNEKNTRAVYFTDNSDRVGLRIAYFLDGIIYTTEGNDWQEVLDDVVIPHSQQTGRDMTMPENDSP